MATLGELKTRIADEIVRSDLTTQISRAIDSAIAFYGRRRFRFNVQDTALAVVAGTTAYTLPTVREVDAILDGDGWPLVGRPAEWFDWDLTATGTPTDWAWRAGVLRLYPTPSAGASFVVRGLVTLPALTSDGQSNAWTTDAEDLIRFRAKADLFANVIRENAEEVAVCRAQEQEAYRELLADAAKAGPSGLIRAYSL